jgi:hypothetical protein
MKKHTVVRGGGFAKSLIWEIGKCNKSLAMI